MSRGLDVPVDWKAYGESMTTKEMDLAIGGMTCNHCAMTVAKELKGLDGVTDANVDLDAKTAHVTLDGTVAPGAVTAAARAAIAEVGYEVVG